MKITEKWYIYRHPETGEEKKVVVRRGQTESSAWEKLDMFHQGFKFIRVEYPEKKECFSCLKSEIE